MKMAGSHNRCLSAENSRLIAKLTIFGAVLGMADILIVSKNSLEWLFL